MAMDGVPAGLGAEGLPASAGSATLGPEPASRTALDLCDGLLGEIGRRMHRFSWLLDPSAPIVSYLPLDAYYPGNRIVVLLVPRTTDQVRVCREQVPAHGLHLLEVDPVELGGDRDRARERLHAQLTALGPLPDRPHERVSPAAPPTAPRTSPPASSNAAPSPTHPRSQSTPPRSYSPPPRGHSTPSGEPAPDRPHTLGEARALAAAAAAAAATHAARGTPRAAGVSGEEQAGIFFGILLALLLGAETLLLVILFALAGGHILLAIGLAFDVCARGLGTVAAVRDNSNDAAWSCIIFGSPAVVTYAMLGERPVQTEPAPLAGALGILALCGCGLWVLGALLGV